jgi:hypothetical protein
MIRSWHGLGRDGDGQEDQRDRRQHRAKDMGEFPSISETLPALVRGSSIRRGTLGRAEGEKPGADAFQVLIL